MSKKKKLTLKEYQDAVWDYLLEHSDLTSGGSLFVKFHTPSRDNFERRVRARAVYNYHRDDTRLNLTTREKEQLHKSLKKTMEVSKETRKLKWKADQEERKRVFAELKKESERVRLLNRYPKLIRPLINRVLNTYATARTKMIQCVRVVLCQLRGTTGRRQRKR